MDAAPLALCDPVGLVGDFHDHQFTLGRAAGVVQCGLIFGAVIAGLGSLDRGKARDDIARALFALKLYETATTGDELPAVFGNRGPASSAYLP